LWERVVERDAQEIYLRLRDELDVTYSVWRRLTKVICVVGFLGPSGSVKCFGRQTVEHVKDQLMVGGPIEKQKTIRAKSDDRHLVACCWGHNAWSPPSSEMRYMLRSWLRRMAV
jgi:hypothetical protein